MPRENKNNVLHFLSLLGLENEFIDFSLYELHSVYAKFQTQFKNKRSPSIPNFTLFNPIWLLDFEKCFLNGSLHPKIKSLTKLYIATHRFSGTC